MPPKKTSNENSSQDSSSASSSPAKFVPPKLAKAGTMVQTAAIGKEYLQKEGHTEFSPLAKTSDKRVTRSQHKLRSTVEELLTDLPETKRQRRSSGKVGDNTGDAKSGSEEAAATRKLYEDQVRMVFRLFDVQKKGAVSTKEILNVMHNLGKRPRKEKISKILEALDPKKTGSVTCDSFVAYMAGKRFGDTSATATAGSATADAAAGTDKGADTKKKEVDSDDESEDEPEFGGVTPSALVAKTNVASLLRKASNLADFYNVHAGETEGGSYIEGAEYDLGRNEAFSAFSVIMYNFAQDASSPFFYSLQEPVQSLVQKGFQTASAANLEQFIESLPNSDECWIAASDTNDVDAESMNKLVTALKAFHLAGKGIAIFGGGAAVTQANEILRGLFGNVSLKDSLPGGQRLLISGNEDAPAGYIARDLLSTGIVSMFEGKNYSTISLEGAAKNDTNFKQLATSNTNKPVIVSVEGAYHKGRVLIDSGLEKFMPGDTWDQQTRRYCSNIAVWLLGLENRMKLNARLAGDVSDVAITCTWEYYLDRYLDGKAPGFHRYSDEAGKIVEAAFLKYLNTDQSGGNIRSYCTVKSGQFTYEVDFKTMTQRNVEHPNHTRRPIRRVEL